MTPGRISRGPSIALLSSGANFSCAVLQALVDHRCKPLMLVLPEYPPASKANAAGPEILPATPQRRLLSLASGIEIAYAPRERQAECAELLRCSGIEFLLVACWPYLIGPELIASATKAALNLHPSLLPRYRGPDPVSQQLANGATDFGVTLHRLNQRFDEGDIVAQAALDNSGSRRQRDWLEQGCAELGVELFVDAIASFPHWRELPQAR